MQIINNKKYIENQEKGIVNGLESIKKKLPNRKDLLHGKYKCIDKNFTIKIYWTSEWNKISGINASITVRKGLIYV